MPLVAADIEGVHCKRVPYRTLEEKSCHTSPPDTDVDTRVVHLTLAAKNTKIQHSSIFSDTILHLSELDSF